MPQQSVERRAGLRHGPVISGDPEMGPLRDGSRGAALPHQRLSALCSPRFFGERKSDQGAGPARHDKRAAEHLAV